MEDVPEKVKKDIKFIFVSYVEDVFKVAFDNWPPKSAVNYRGYTPIPVLLAAN